MNTESDTSPTASILVVEDSDALRRGLCELVRQMGLFGAVHEAADGFAALKVLRNHPIDIVVCDLQMPRCDGYGLLRLAKGDTRIAHIPILMLTADDDIATRVKLLSSGASDYVPKPAHPEELGARLWVHLELKRAGDALREKTDELERLTRTDALTGVSNRRHLDESLAQEFDRALRYRRPLSAMMIDLDHFKKLNDTFGHAAGDHALASVGEILRGQARKTDLVARYGGEEFAIVLPETTPAHGMVAAERIRREIERADVRWDGRRLPITASIGVAGFPSVDVAAPHELLARADAALYGSKQAGRNRVTHALGLVVMGKATGAIRTIAHN